MTIHPAHNRGIVPYGTVYRINRKTETFMAFQNNAWTKALESCLTVPVLIPLAYASLVGNNTKTTSNN